MKYKTTIRIPTDPYAYLEVDYEGEPDEVVGVYQQFTKLLKPQAGLPAKEWNSALDRYLVNNDLDAEVYESMSREQKDLIQEIKRSLARIKSKNNK